VRPPGRHRRSDEQPAPSTIRLRRPQPIEAHPQPTGVDHRFPGDDGLSDPVPFHTPTSLSKLVPYVTSGVSEIHKARLLLIA